MTRSQQVEAYLECVMGIANIVRNRGEVPSGHLYAELMGVMTLDTYESAVRHLKGAGLVSESGHLLKWTGPQLERAAA